MVFLNRRRNAYGKEQELQGLDQFGPPLEVGRRKA